MELLDIYDNNGNKTGRVVVRGDKSIALNENEHIAVGAIYIENDNGKFLIQKTSKAKGDNYSSTGGHIDSGETPLESIKRETKEKLGLNIDNDNIVELGYLLYDKPIRFMFYLKKNVALDELNIQEDEVDSVKFMTVDDVNNLIEKGLMVESHAKIFKKVLEYKKNKAL